ncbi:MAG: hypothetical protein KF791_11345, partial [Verrucomicrobiae bacterium]|nr:hypothetical protein [Verrucomicrobiae bacterium]
WRVGAGRHDPVGWFPVRLSITTTDRRAWGRAVTFIDRGPQVHHRDGHAGDVARFQRNFARMKASFANNVLPARDLRWVRRMQIRLA